MSALDRRTLLLAGLALPGAASERQEPPDFHQPGFYHQVVPNPTGRNGFEELVAAADEMCRSDLFKQAEARLGTRDGCPLALKRRVLRDPHIIRALDLLRRGLAKPIAVTHDLLDPDAQEPEIGEFLRMGKALLPLRQDVLLADGESRAALDVTRLGLRLGFGVQFDEMWFIETGMAFCNGAARAIGEHLGQLTAADCDELYRIAIEWLRRPDPLLRAVEAARAGDHRALDDLRGANRAQLEKRFLLDPVTINPSDTPIDFAATNNAILKQIDALEHVRDGPGGAQAFANARALLDDHYDRVAAECRKAPWERSDVRMDAGDSPAARVLMGVNQWFPFGPRDDFIEYRAYAQLLACHAAIRRYRWEHDHLPRDLEALKLGEIAVDPFTGKLFEYEVSGERYRLASAGAYSGPHNNLPGGRRPVTLVPGE